MSKRHHCLPKIWLMTDERLGDRLIPAIRALPRGAGIIFRHYATPAKARRVLFDAVHREARRHGHMLLLAGSARQARGWRADGTHGRHFGALTAPVHSVPEMRAAEKRGARLLFLSPLYPTQSHPGGRAMGRVRFLAMRQQARQPVIALGGMTQGRFKRIAGAGVYGWAAIDGLSGGPDQKRKAVPR
jgi:thiamine-phosphate pyrophosphorylase